MEGEASNRGPCGRCRSPKEFALGSHVRHPGNVYLREADLLPAIDNWLVTIFAPHRLEQTIREMQAAQEPATPVPAPAAPDVQALIAHRDPPPARHQAAPEARRHPQPPPQCARHVQAARAAALA